MGSRFYEAPRRDLPASFGAAGSVVRRIDRIAVSGVERCTQHDSHPPAAAMRMSSTTFSPEQSPWFRQLDKEAQIVARTALRLHSFLDRQQVAERCDFVAFSLHEYLRRRWRIHTDVVVGYLGNDRTPVRRSHAWLDHRGMRIDVAMEQGSWNGGALPRDALVLDRVIRFGIAQNSYHLQPSPETLQMHERFAARSPESAEFVAQKQQEHRDMLRRAQDDLAMWTWLQFAPEPLSYAAVERVMAAAG